MTFKKLYNSEIFWPSFILAVFGIMLLIISVANHYYFRTNAYDYAAYNFAFYDYAHFRISPSPIYWVKEMSFLQDHLSFTLMFFVPLYWLLYGITGTYTLLLIQLGFVIFGGWGVFKLLKLETNSNLLSNLGLLLYFISFGRYSSLITDVNLMIILSSVVPVFLYYFQKKNYLLAGIWFAFLLLGRESIPLWTIFIAAFLIVYNWNDKKSVRISIIYIIISVIYFIICFKVLIPLIQNPDRPFNLFNYSALGDTPFEALLYMLTHPEQCFIMLFENHLKNPIFDSVKLEFYWVYLLSGGIFLFYKPKYAIIFIPVVFQKMFNDGEFRWGIESYYSIEFVTLLPITAFLAINEINSNKIKKISAIGICVIAFVMTIHKIDVNNRVLNWYTVDKIKIYDKRMFTSKFDVPFVNDVLKSIPDTAKVSASGKITSHLAYRPKCYYFPRVDDAEYIILFSNDEHFMQTKQEFDFEVNKYLFNKEWSIYIDKYPLLILKKYSSDTIKWKRYFTDFENDSTYIFSKKIKLTNEQSYSGLNSVLLDSLNKFSLEIPFDSIKLGSRIKVNVWRKGKGELVLSSENSDKIYTTECQMIKENSDGWQLLSIDIGITKQWENNRLNFYVWNSNSNDKAYFDDIEVYYYN